MANNFAFKLNRAGVRELLKSEEMLQIVQEYAENAAENAGEGYVASTYVGRNRVNAEVAAESLRARYDNSKNNTILKSLGANK